MTIEELDLQPDVEEKARELQRMVPGVVFTSGRRTLQQQAAAMAHNIVVSGNRRWIVHTYAASIAITLLQGWVNHHPGANEQELESGLLTIFEKLSPIQRASMSRHLTGRALDILPETCTVEEIEKTSPRKILTHEGELARLHVEW